MNFLKTNRLFAGVVSIIVIAVIVGVIIVPRLRPGSDIPGIGSSIPVENGSIQVESVERTDVLIAPDGRQARPADGNEIVLILVNVEGTVPSAGADPASAGRRAPTSR